MSLSDLLCRVLLEKLLELGLSIGRRGELALTGRDYLEVLGCDEGRPKSCIVGVEGLDELSGSPAGGR
jgi:hypothetical protein